MTHNDNESRQALLKSIHEAFSTDYPAGEARQLQYLAEKLLERAPMDCFADKHPKRIARMLQSLNQYIAQRMPDEIKLRVYNPDLETHGWESENTIIEMVNMDMPFLVDTVSLSISELDAECLTHVILHPVISANRDAGGNVLDYEELDDDQTSNLESIIHVQISKRTGPAELKMLQEGIMKSLEDARLVVSNWSAMCAKAESVAQEMKESNSRFLEEDVLEASRFISWLVDEHFTFLGYQQYKIVQGEDHPQLISMPETALGLFARSHASSHLEFKDQDFRLTPKEPIIVTKTNARSSVHRRGYMDYIGVLQFDQDGQVIGEQRFIGLFTSSAYYRRPWEVPYLRHQVENVIQRSGLKANSHNGKALLHVLETLPRDELFQGNIDDLCRLAMGVMQLQERRVTRVFIRADRYGRYYSCLIYIPRDRFNTEIRQQLVAVLTRGLSGSHTDFAVQLSQNLLARIHIIVRADHIPEQLPDEAAIESEVRNVIRDWKDELSEALLERLGEEQGARLANRFADALPTAYREDVSPWVASFDLEHIDALQNTSDMRMSLYRPRKRRVGLYRFKVFRYEETIPLSDVLPMLENMGLRVVNERPYELILNPDLRLWIQDFDIQLRQEGEVDLEAVREEFQLAFEKIVRGVVEDDGFNRLILAAQLNWKQASLLRACCKYLLQTSNPFSQQYMEQTLYNHPELSYLLVELFTALFSPGREQESPEEKAWGADEIQSRLALIRSQRKQIEKPNWLADLLASRQDNRENQVQGVQDAIIAQLETVRSQDEDRILRSFMMLIMAVMRTNYYQEHTDPNTEPFLAFKLRSTDVPELPKPRPLFEIFVYSPRVEGVHLRGGKVARGGLRWSDRREDFRTEVLGLMKAQQVKNTIIVPVGAKGGFVVKQLPQADRDTQMIEVVHCYRTFIGGLLDLTDNLVQDEIVPPPLTVMRDESDPYLVVAADKGTATFSDIANAISERRGFWMGDAFASGGSVGYDHKKMGITARGAWESVKRHFRELGMNCQKQVFTCVGIGDMGGDVFGNGMLLSRKTRLMAAFNHLHIFIDPDPDPDASFKERERLFALPRSSWEDYDSRLISKGGGVWSRSLKSIPLTPQIQAWLGIDAPRITPQELIRELIKAPVDLMWNGGIGTYVKSSLESNQDVGDHNNDILRVDGRELRCRVIGEGGNLGLTQLGRVEFALRGGRINTDFVDNAGGVDCSDHEVNIKILLNLAMQDNRLTLSERDALLESMTDEVAEQVLRSNYLQAQALSMMSAMTVTRLGAKAHLIAVLEQSNILDRQLEFLPGQEEIQERRAKGLGFSRPELSVLLSYAKMSLYQELIESDLPDDPYFEHELEGYFPTPLREPFRDLMPKHRLKREIIATMLTNSMVNRMGSTFKLRMQEDTGASTDDIAKAFTLARELLDAREFWKEVEALDHKIPADVQIDLLLEMWNLLRHICRWLLNNHGHQLNIVEYITLYKPQLKALQSHLYRSLDAMTQERVTDRTTALEKSGVPHQMARYVSLLPLLYAGLDLVELSNERDVGVEKTAKLYFYLGDRLNLNWLAGQIESLPVEGQWHANARAALRDELCQHHRDLLLNILKRKPQQAVKTLVADWIKQRKDNLDHLQHMLGDMRASSHMDYAMVSVAIRGVKRLIRACERENKE